MLPLFIILPLQLVLFLAFATTPYVTRKSENFGIKTPEEQFSSPQMNALRRRYIWQCGISTLVFTLPALAALYMGAGEFFSAMLYTGCVFALLAVIFLFYLQAHRTVKRWKAEQNWTYERVQVAAASTAPLKKVASPLWVLLPSLLAVATALWLGYTRYPDLPDMVATHWNLEGIADGFTAKSQSLIWMIPGMQLFLAVIFTGVAAMFRVTRRQLDSADPQESLRRGHLFRQAWTIYCIALGDLMVFSFILLQAAMFELMHPSAATYIILGVAGIAVVGAIALSLIVGQGGSRLRAPAKTSDIDRDDDRYWKLGSFYYNPEDPAVFVEKRFGVGITNNFARPATWVMMGALLLLIAASVILPFLFA